MIVDVRLTPKEAKRARVYVDGVDVTWRCYRADTVTGTAWVYQMDQQGKILEPIKYEYLTGIVRIDLK